MMSAPSAAIFTAWARPWPRAAPVMSTTLPSSRPVIACSSWCPWVGSSGASRSLAPRAGVAQHLAERPVAVRAGLPGEAEEAGLPQEGGEQEAREGEFVPGYASGNARARGRFTRNFVVQGSAADWALLMLAALRRALAGMRAELVFFQHDEVIVHTPEREAEAVTRALHTAASEAARLLFGPTPVVFPMEAATVPCYADAK